MRSSKVDAECCLHSRSLRPCGLVHLLGLELRNPGLELLILGHGLLIHVHNYHKFSTVEEVSLVRELFLELADLGICTVHNLAAIELFYDVSEENSKLEFCFLVASLDILLSLHDTHCIELSFLVPVLHSLPKFLCCFNCLFKSLLVWVRSDCFDGLIHLFDEIFPIFAILFVILLLLFAFLWSQIIVGGL